MRIALAISILFALLYCALGQPLPQGVVEPPEPPQTFTEIVGWNPGAWAGLRMQVSNAAVNYFATMPGTSISNAVQSVRGTNHLWLWATNAAGLVSAPAKLRWVRGEDTVVRLDLMEASSLLGPRLTVTNVLTLTNPPGNKFYALNIAKTNRPNWRVLP